MKSELFAIADAGGNIYQHTFGNRPEGEWFRHVLPNLEICEMNILEEATNKAKARGDHVVKCVIETQETVTIKSEPV